MTSEIIVFQPPEQKEVVLSKTEIELLYEDLEKYSPLDSHHFKAFYDMEMEDIQSSIVDSTIASIMFKYITKFVFPIIREIPKLNLKSHRRTVKKKITKEHVINEFFFTMQFSKPTPGFTKTGESIILVPNVCYQILGIKIPKKLQIFRDISIPDFISVINIFNLTTMGHYGMKNFNTGRYIQERSHFLHPSYANDIIGKKIIFQSNEHALEIIKNIIDIFADIQNYYETYHSTVYTSLQFKPFSEFRKKLEEKSIKLKDWDKLSLKEMPLTPELEKIRKIYKGVLSKYETRFNQDIWNGGIFDIFQKVKILGIGHIKSQEILEDLIQRNADEDNIKFQKKQKTDSYLEFAKKQSISFEKFKIKNLNNLNTQQKKVVDLQYANIKKIEEETKKMSESIHIVGQLYKSVEDSNYDDMRKYMKKIHNMLPAYELKGNLEDKEKLLKDKEGVSIVCPHILSKTNKIIESNRDPIKLSKVREHIISWYSLPDVSLGYFCRICGALLADQDEEEIVQFLNGHRVNFIQDIDSHKSFVWKEVAHIISTFVKFKESVNLKKIITSITNAIRGEIGVIETRLAKVKTNSNDSIKDLLRIYITIYTYAVVIHMIYLNYGRITFSTKESKKGGKINFIGLDNSSLGHIETDKQTHMSTKLEVLGVEDCEHSSSDADEESESPFVQGGKKMEKQKKGKRVKRALQKEDKKRLQNIFREAIELIIKSKNALLNKLSNISIDSIKPLLIKAYQWVVSLKTDMKTEDNIRKHNTAYFLSIDPIYEYLWYAHSMKLFSEKKKQSRLSDIKRYLGRSLTEIEDDYEVGKTIYETAKDPGSWGESTKAKYDYGSFKYLFEYTKDKVYNYDFIPKHEVITSFEKKYQYLQTLAENIEQETTLRLIQPLMRFPLEEDLVQKYNDFGEDKINISNYFCSDGSKHKFNIFVFHKALPSGVLDSKETMEVTKKDVNNWLDNDQKEKLDNFKYYFLVDEKCSNCGIYISKVSKDKNINKKLTKLRKLKSFYDYFENRCPEGNLHNYKIDAQKNIENCSKCNFVRKLMENLDKKYYDKYVENYKKILEKQKFFDQEALMEFENISKVVKLDLKTFPKWTINNKSVLQLSRNTNTKYNILINLGLSEGRKFENLEKEKENPHINSTEEEDILRNQYLRDYCLWFLRLYYIMKNYSIVHTIPPHLKDIIEKNKKFGVENMKSVLPDIYDKFNEKYSYYFRTLTPKLLSNFLLNYLCNSLNTVLEKTSNTNFMNLGKDFVTHCIEVLIQSEKDVSKPPPLSLIINKGQSTDFSMVAGDEFYDISEDDESRKSLEELGDSTDGDDFARNDLDFDMSDGMEDNYETNYMDS